MKRFIRIAVICAVLNLFVWGNLFSYKKYVLDTTGAEIAKRSAEAEGSVVGYRAGHKKAYIIDEGAIEIIKVFERAFQSSPCVQDAFTDDP